MPEYVAPEHMDVAIEDGNTLRIVYEMTIGDMLVCTFVALLIMLVLLVSLMKIKWR